MSRALALGDAAVAVGSVAVADVGGERMLEGVPVEVVGVVDDELGDRAEMRLDAVEVAGVGGQRDELDVVLVGERADLGSPVGREVVLDPVEPDPARVAEPDLVHEGERVLAAAAAHRSEPEPVLVDVERAEAVADAVAAVEGRAVALGAAPPGPARAVPGAQRDRPHLIERDHRPALGRPLVELTAHAPPWPRSRGPAMPSRSGCAGTKDRPARAAARDGRARSRRSPLAQIGGQLRKPAAREWLPQSVGTGTATATIRLRCAAVIRRGRPPPNLGRSDSNRRSLNSWITLRTCDSSVCHIEAICGTPCLVADASRIDAPLPRREVFRLLGHAPQPLALLRRQLAHEHRRGTHHHLQTRVHASLFADRGQFPVQRCGKAH
jgi:hypothetical protein